MIQRKAEPAKPEGNDDDQYSSALQQYNDTEGHFSLVRSVQTIRHPLYPRTDWIQEFPTGRPCDDYERILRIVLPILFCELSPNKRRILPSERLALSTRWAHI